uniref:CYFIP related Rac1 interactor B n=1 Tax=Xenopus tropicalis TaxID=8364 RepID=A0A6I8SU63_XENTR
FAASVRLTNRVRASRRRVGGPCGRGWLVGGPFGRRRGGWAVLVAVLQCVSEPGAVNEKGAVCGDAAGTLGPSTVPQCVPPDRGEQTAAPALVRDAQPSESEKEVYNQVNVVLKDAEGILDHLQSYRGAGHEIREAIQHATDEKLQEKAWAAVVPLVGKLKKFYEFSQRLEAALRGLLGALTSTPYSPTQHLEREQALAKQFAEILHFTLRFDELKMTNPAIQNDFSYYRRTLSRMRINNVPAEGENEVNNELANRMSLFYAEATPMLKTLSDATTKFVSENKNLPIENTTDCLSTMASVCRVMLETPEYRSRFTNEETVSFCLRVMVGVIILYDHVHPVGAFAKTSKIDMKGCIKVLKEQPPNSVEGLLNALRYTTKHLNDETTSKQIKTMLQ